MSGKQSLLLVDADPKSLRVLDVSLKKAGFDVVTATNGREALSLIATRMPDLVISDTQMPDVDGFALCASMKAEPELAKVPFIFLTSRRAIEDKIRGLELGVEDYLTKPIYIKEITTRVRILLQRRERERLESKRSDGRTKFAGQLSDISLVDLVQTLEVNRKSGIIHLSTREGRRASVFFRDGQIIDAEVGRLGGAEAVYRLFSWSDGTFEVEFKAIRRKDVIDLGPQALLMEGMRRLDEWTRQLTQMPSLEAVFEVDFRELANRLGDIPDEVNGILRLFDGRRSLLQVIDDSDFPDLDALAAVRRLFEDRVLLEVDRVAPAPTQSSPTAVTTPSGRLDKWLSESTTPRAKTPPVPPPRHKTVPPAESEARHGATPEVIAADILSAATVPLPLAPSSAEPTAQAPVDVGGEARERRSTSPYGTEVLTTADGAPALPTAPEEGTSEGAAGLPPDGAEVRGEAEGRTDRFGSLVPDPPESVASSLEALESPASAAAIAALGLAESSTPKGRADEEATPGPQLLDEVLASALGAAPTETVEGDPARELASSPSENPEPTPDHDSEPPRSVAHDDEPTVVNRRIGSSEPVNGVPHLPIEAEAGLAGTRLIDSPEDERPRRLSSADSSRGRRISSGGMSHAAGETASAAAPTLIGRPAPEVSIESTLAESAAPAELPAAPVAQAHAPDHDDLSQAEMLDELGMPAWKNRVAVGGALVLGGVLALGLFKAGLLPWKPGREGVASEPRGSVTDPGALAKSAASPTQALAPASSHEGAAAPAASTGSREPERSASSALAAQEAEHAAAADPRSPPSASAANDKAGAPPPSEVPSSPRSQERPVAGTPPSGPAKPAAVGSPGTAAPAAAAQAKPVPTPEGVVASRPPREPPLPEKKPTPAAATAVEAPKAAATSTPPMAAGAPPAATPGAVAGPPAPADPDAAFREALSACRQASSRERYGAVLSSCGKALASKSSGSEAVEAITNIANAELGLEHAPAVFKWVKKLNALDPTYADAWMLQGGAEQLVGRDADARRSYERYLQLAPNGRYAAELKSIVAHLPP